MWPILTLLLAVALIGLHLWWRNRFHATQTKCRKEMDALQQAQEGTARELLTQQETLFNSMIEGLLLLDEEGRIQLANRAFSTLFGVTKHIHSRTIMEALRLHELGALVESLGTQKQVLGFELKLSHPNERLLEVNAAAIFDARGNRRGTILVFHDLTRLKQLERTRQDFVANVSHELRTPLSLIKGYVETLLDGAGEDPEIAARFLHTIDRNTERLKLLIEDLLTISELESGRVKLSLQPVHLRNVVEKVFADFRTRADARGIALIEQTPDLRLRADVDRLEQVLCNLVDNAIKYGRTNGRVTVSARQTESGLVEVSVKDDGPGIPSDSLPRIFERFYRVDKARSREQGGTGLGLSIVKHIIQSHGGKVWAHSDIGHGVTFYFTLPSDASTSQQPTSGNIKR